MTLQPQLFIISILITLLMVGITIQQLVEVDESKLFNIKKVFPLGVLVIIIVVFGATLIFNAFQ